MGLINWLQFNYWCFLFNNKSDKKVKNHLQAPAVQAALCPQPGSSVQTQNIRWWLPWGEKRDRARQDGIGWVHWPDTHTWQTEGWRPPSGKRRRADDPQTSHMAALPGSEGTAGVFQSGCVLHFGKTRKNIQIIYEIYEHLQFWT